jgi:hypothetical protein
MLGNASYVSNANNINHSIAKERKDSNINLASNIHKVFYNMIQLHNSIAKEPNKPAPPPGLNIPSPIAMGGILKTPPPGFVQPNAMNSLGISCIDENTM